MNCDLLKIIEIQIVTYSLMMSQKIHIADYPIIETYFPSHTW